MRLEYMVTQSLRVAKSTLPATEANDLRARRTVILGHSIIFSVWTTRIG